MRILNVMQCTNLGGMEQASLRLMIGLKKLGHSCHVLSLNPLGALKPLLEINGISADGLEYSGKGGWRSIGRFRKKLKTYKSDALIMTGHNLLAMQAIGGLETGRKILALHFHHQGVKPAWQWQLIYWLASKRFDEITYPSEFIRGEAIDLYPALRNMSRVVRNPLEVPAVPTADERKRARAVLELPVEAKLIGNAGWLIKRKRFDVFLYVAQQVASIVPDAVFVIAGDGEERDKLVRLAASLGIAERIKWLGWQQDMSTLYKALDVLLFNSDWDALGNTPLEAMSYGLPVVASVENGGLKEVIHDDACGYLFHTHDIQAMTKAITSCMSGAGQAIGEQGRERVRKLCGFDHCVKEIEHLLSGQESLL